MSSFAIWIGGTWVAPPVEAMPIGIGSPIIDGAPIVRSRVSTARSGLGYPAGIDDELYARVGRPNIGTSGLQWWYQTVGIQASSYKNISVRLWNPITRAWTAYSGVMWAPTYVTGMAGYRITDFQVMITNLQII